MTKHFNKYMYILALTLLPVANSYAMEDPTPSTDLTLVEELTEKYKELFGTVTEHTFEIDPTSEETNALIEALKSKNILQKLNINFAHSFRDNEAIALGEMLKTNKTLQHITLYFHNIGDKGFAALLEALKVNKTLLTLSHFAKNTLSLAATMDMKEIAIELDKNRKISECWKLYPKVINLVIKDKDNVIYNALPKEVTIFIIQQMIAVEIEIQNEIAKKAILENPMAA